MGHVGSRSTSKTGRATASKSIVLSVRDNHNNKLTAKFFPRKETLLEISESNGSRFLALYNSNEMESIKDQLAAEDLELTDCSQCRSWVRKYENK